MTWVDSLEEKLATVEAEPHKFFTTEHYDGDPLMLARLDRIDVAEADELVTESWRLRAPDALGNAWDQTSAANQADHADPDG